VARIARLISLALTASIFVLGATGCTHVAPYEREYLALPCMDTTREGNETKFRAHVHDSREGATGGHGSTGGGCGCN
jgi:hypothetical protein